MDLGSILILLALLIGVAAFVARPLLERQSTVVSEEEQTLSAMLARRDRILDALLELDFDYKLGKIPEGDYPAARAALLQQGADILKKLDPYLGESPHQADPLEAAIAARRRQTSAQAENGSSLSFSLPDPDDEIEVMLARRRRARKVKSAGFCAQCGHPLQSNDKFCSNCGKPVKQP